jgi:hypothetical protein
MNMIDYHVYTLGKNGHLTGRVDLKCPNDEAAEKRVRLLMDRDDVELWRLDGRVVVFRTKPDDLGGDLRDLRMDLPAKIMLEELEYRLVLAVIELAGMVTAALAGVRVLLR